MLCPHCIYMVCMYLWTKSLLFSLQHNWFSFITGMKCVHCAVRAGYINKSVCYGCIENWIGNDDQVGGSLLFFACLKVSKNLHRFIHYINTLLMNLSYPHWQIDIFCVSEGVTKLTQIYALIEHPVHEFELPALIDWYFFKYFVGLQIVNKIIFWKQVVLNFRYNP
jgi:hypothetical protein